MASCAIHGGCPSDYAVVGFAAASFVLLCIRASYPFLYCKGPRTRTNDLWIVVVQIFGSFNLVLGFVMSLNYFNVNKRHPWQSCYIWGVWLGGALGFGLLISFRIVQVYQLYYLFVKRRLPSIKSNVLIPLILLPWMGGATAISITKPLNANCHIHWQWIAPVVCFIMLYISALIWLAYAIRHIEFRFQELKDLLRGIIISATATGVWIIAYVLIEVQEYNSWVQVISRFLLLFTVGILVLAFFSMSISQPLLSQMSLSGRRSVGYLTMGEALGIREGDSSQKASHSDVDFNEPLDRLLLDDNFRRSFMAYADSCLAGEGVHFYDEVLELGRYMEVNISHRTRQEILTCEDLTSPHLFDHAVVELLQLLKANLFKDYWSSVFFMKLKAEQCKEPDGQGSLDHLRHPESSSFSWQW
ncbi:unnamed protein product [Spirodela intermedia]|uniref:Uncharacterized protein n=1 Tax=Spirodela intermedia TaxID=51605 RepID=A0A7I8IR37_SPIIN|nr:unnamed protein product [Spirodela intermedia]CAA6659632.1 unnamed protein product [Spirodela intermedia]